MAKLNYYIHVSSSTGQLFLTILANIGTNPKGRIYLDGTGPPGFTDMSGTYTVALPGLSPNGLYIVEFENDEDGLRQLAKIDYISTADSCWDEDLIPASTYNESGYSLTITVNDIKLHIQHGVSFVPPVGAGAQLDRSRAVSIDGGLTWKNVVGVVAEWTNSELAALGYDFEVPTIRVKRLSNGCTTIHAFEVVIDKEVFEPMEVSYDKTNCTANGVDDGTITLTIEGGSGNYSFAWLDGPITQNRNGLAVGSYTVIVTDEETEEEVTIEDIEITEPIPEPQLGSFLKVPSLNSLFFIVSPVEPDGETILQTLDNVLFRKQVFPGYTRANYWQKVCKVDRPIVQFQSDYSSHEVVMYDCLTELPVLSFPVVLKEQNIGKSQDFAVLIKNHTVVGQSRIYFGAGAPPTPVEVGQPFELLNNVEGFNGNYSIVEILNDDTVGYPYLVINKNYDSPNGQSPATIRFVSTDVNYNVFESVIDPSTLAEGAYYVRIKAFDIVLPDEDANEKFAYSEPISLKTVHPRTNLLVYRNFDNAYDMTWTTGYVGMKRVESLFGHKRLPGGERTTSRNSNFDLIKTASKKIRGLMFELFMLPPYLHEVLSVIFDLDHYTINGVECQSSDGYSDPNYHVKYPLASSSIKLEQVGWFEGYNNNDIGTVTEEGFIESEDGFIKST